MRRIGYLALGLVLMATTVLAADRGKDVGRLARLATPARLERTAEIAKDATPPKPPKRPSDYRATRTQQVRIPIGR
jgi:hypothetical protein